MPAQSYGYGSSSVGVISLAETVIRRAPSLLLISIYEIVRECLVFYRLKGLTKLASPLFLSAARGGPALHYFTVSSTLAETTFAETQLRFVLRAPGLLPQPVPHTWASPACRLTLAHWFYLSRWNEPNLFPVNAFRKSYGVWITRTFSFPIAGTSPTCLLAYFLESPIAMVAITAITTMPIRLAISSMSTSVPISLTDSKHTQQTSYIEWRTMGASQNKKREQAKLAHFLEHLKNGQCQRPSFVDTRLRLMGRRAGARSRVNMDASFWHQRWRTNEIPFHEHAVNQQLLKHFSALSLAKAAGVCAAVRQVS